VKIVYIRFTKVMQCDRKSTQIHGMSLFTSCSQEHDAALSQLGNTSYFCISCGTRWINHDCV